MNIPSTAFLDADYRTAFLDADYRKAMTAMLKGEAFDMEAILRQEQPEVIAAARVKLAAAQAWVAGAADCLECGACCEQGWRVDVEPSDLERMSNATRENFVVVGSTRAAESDADGRPRTFAATLKLVQIGPPKFTGAGPQQQCACLGPDPKVRACSIYEERPEICRTFPKGHARCVQARVERGLPVSA
jgi:Fe-S-cluster containining protein